MVITQSESNLCYDKLKKNSFKLITKVSLSRLRAAVQGTDITNNNHSNTFQCSKSTPKILLIMVSHWLVWGLHLTQKMKV